MKQTLKMIFLPNFEHFVASEPIPVINFSCEKCPKTYTNKKSLNIHRYEYHAAIDMQYSNGKQ